MVSCTYGDEHVHIIMLVDIKHRSKAMIIHSPRLAQRVISSPLVGTVQQ